jgi:hypothetical protein
MIKLICIAIILLSIIGCGEDKQSPPVIFSLDANPKIVLPSNPSTLTVEAGDPDKSKLSYLWTASSGQINGNGKTVTWTSPKEEGKYEITVTVSDGTDSATQKIFLRVWIPRPGDYYPLTVGNKWTYNDKEGNIINFEVIDTIDIAGTKAFVKKTTITNMEDSASYSYISKGTDVVNQHAVGGSSAGDDTLIFTPVLPLYKFPLIPEELWNVEFEVNVPDGYFVGSGKSTYKVLSEEEVSVKAGTFEHVFQVEEDFTWEIFGQELDHTIAKQWLAPNVGMIKFITEQTRGGETFITEAELESYSVEK